MNRNDRLLLLTAAVSLVLPLGVSLYNFGLQRPVVLAVFVGVPAAFLALVVYNAFRYYR